MEHFLRVTSNNSSLENTIKTTLPHHIHLQHNGIWKVALSSVYIQLNDDEDNLFLEVKNDDGKIHRINYKMEDILEKGDSLFIDTICSDILKHFDWYFNDFIIWLENGHVIAQVYRKLSIRFSKNLGYKLGNITNGYDGAGQWFHLNTSRLTLIDPVDFSRKVKKSLITVKSNTADHGVVNDRFDNILKVLCREKNGEEEYYYEAKNLEFVNVASSVLIDLQVSFHDQAGNDVLLQKNCTNFVNLIFKFFT